MEFMTIDKTRCLGILDDELGQMMEIRPDLRRRILNSASKAMDLSEVGLPTPEVNTEVVIVDANLNEYMTKNEIMNALDKLDIEYKRSMKRPELLDLLAGLS